VSDRVWTGNERLWKPKHGRRRAAKGQDSTDRFNQVRTLPIVRRLRERDKRAEIAERPFGDAVASSLVKVAAAVIILVAGSGYYFDRQDASEAAISGKPPIPRSISQPVQIRS
jgi:hypothetical protein